MKFDASIKLPKSYIESLWEVREGKKESDRYYFSQPQKRKLLKIKKKNWYSHQNIYGPVFVANPLASK